MWSVQDAKSHLSEILRRARAGEPQTIGTRDGCVVISAEEFARLNEVQKTVGEPKLHLGQWLIANSPKVDDFVLPERKPGRSSPFESFWNDEK
jgi:prevent-host-death family protein